MSSSCFLLFKIFPFFLWFSFCLKIVLKMWQFWHSCCCYFFLHIFKTCKFVRLFRLYIFCTHYTYKQPKNDVKLKNNLNVVLEGYKVKKYFLLLSIHSTHQRRESITKYRSLQNNRKNNVQRCPSRCLEINPATQTPLWMMWILRICFTFLPLCWCINILTLCPCTTGDGIRTCSQCHSENCHGVDRDGKEPWRNMFLSTRPGSGLRPVWKTGKKKIEMCVKSAGLCEGNVTQLSYYD